MTSKDYQILADNYRRDYHDYNRLIARELLPSKKAKLREQRDNCIRQIEILYLQFLNAQKKEQKERERENNANN